MNQLKFKQSQAYSSFADPESLFMEEFQPESRKKMTMVLGLIALLVALVGSGAAFYFFVLSKPKKSRYQRYEEVASVDEKEKDNQSEVKEPKTTEKPNTASDPAESTEDPNAVRPPALDPRRRLPGETTEAYYSFDMETTR